MHSVAARTSYIKRFCKISTSSKARSKLRKAAGTNVGSHKKRQTMRKILLFLFALITAISLKGQDLSGFKYVFVPTLTYQNGGKDIWSISSKLRTLFMQKGFIVLNESSTAPQELQKDPCLLLRCFIDHTNVTYGKNSVNLTLKDCNDRVVLTSKGSAAGWSVQDDFNKATRRAFDKISDLPYRFSTSKTPKL